MKSTAWIRPLKEHLAQKLVNRHLSMETLQKGRRQTIAAVKFVISGKKEKGEPHISKGSFLAILPGTHPDDRWPLERGYYLAKKFLKKNPQLGITVG